MPVVATALGGFLILLTILALQMRAGHDPALKPSVTAAPPRTILKRRIIKTRVIITDAPTASAGVAGRLVSGPRGSAAAPAPAVAGGQRLSRPRRSLRAASRAGPGHEDVMTAPGRSTTPASAAWEATCGS